MATNTITAPPAPASAVTTEEMLRRAVAKMTTASASRHISEVVTAELIRQMGPWAYDGAEEIVRRAAELKDLRRIVQSLQRTDTIVAPHSPMERRRAITVAEYRRRPFDVTTLEYVSHG